MVNQKRKTERKNENSKLLKFIVHLVVSLLRVGIVADTKKMQTVRWSMLKYGC